MMKFNTVIRKNRPDKNGLFNVEIQATFQNSRIYFLTGFKVKHNQFRAGLVINHAASDKINTAIQLQLSSYIEKSIRNTRDLSRLSTQQIRQVLAGDLIARVYFFDVINELIEMFGKAGSDNSRGLYLYTRNIVNAYSPGVYLDEITPGFLQKLEVSLKKKGVKQNTIAAVFRYIRIVFNIAIKEQLISPTLYPFRNFRIKTEKTIKRSLTVEEIKLLMTVETMAVDVFMLSFFLIGINIKDLLYSERDQIENGRLVYFRFKTMRPYSIKVEPEVWEILKKYPGELLLLNMMEKRKRLDQFTKYINKHLRKAAGTVGIDKHLTSYWARHSWATIASNQGIDKDTIAKALGHGGNTVTDIYIDFDLVKVDQANRIVIESVC